MRYSAQSATEKAREIHPEAFAKVSDNSIRAERCQLLVPHDGQTLLVASGPDWLEALARFYEWAEEYGEEFGATIPKEWGGKPRKESTHAVDEPAQQGRQAT